MTAQHQIAGGWTAYHALTPEDQIVFKEALAGFVGVQYTPTAVSTQVVNGVNYRYKTTTVVPGPVPHHGEAIVQIYAPINGKPHITHINQI